MEDRYPYIRFVIDAAQLIAGAVALIIVLGGLVNSCHHGGFGGIVSFLVTLAFAAVAYVVVMVEIEVLRVLLDIEQTTRQSRPPQQASGAPPSPGTGS
jgi:predicted lipid-binding transport protein (Tim44 family)